jgi:hypothetical protein
MSMNAVDPVRKLRSLSSESRVLRRGVLGDKVDGPSREGRFLTKCERELVAQVGGQPSFTQKLLIRRLSRAMLRLELLDEKAQLSELTDHDGRVFGGLNNVVRLISRELGLKAAPAEKTLDLSDVIAEHALRKALQQVIDKIAESLAKAESDVTANGTTGSYAIAAVYNRDYLAEVHQYLLFLQSWLKSQGLDTPFVTNASAAYNIHGYVREAVCSLHYARHWATISVVYHNSSDAFESFNLTSEAIDLAEPLGAQAGRCYMRSYFP